LNAAICRRPGCNQMEIPSRLRGGKRTEVYSINGTRLDPVGRNLANAWVKNGQARRYGNGAAIQLTETITEASRPEITPREMEANAGLLGSDTSIASARSKVKAWPLVGSDPAYGVPTKSIGIRVMSREELERPSVDFNLMFVALKPVPPLMTHTSVGICQDLDEDDDKTEAEHAESEEESLLEQTCHEADVERYLSGDEETPEPPIAKSLVDVEGDDEAAHWLQENEGPLPEDEQDVAAGQPQESRRAS